ncbi:MAG: AbrB/MazE/SpoVT family DNA-binding domain-containing protein [Candidatus Shapirobacteria bacterium]
MLQSTTITKKWQMTLPKEIRDLLDLKEPGSFLLELVDRKKKLIRIKKKIDILDLAGSLKSSKKKGVLEARSKMEKIYKRF